MTTKKKSAPADDTSTNDGVADDGTSADRPAAVHVPLSATDGDSSMAYLHGGSDFQWDCGGGCVG